MAEDTTTLPVQRAAAEAAASSPEEPRPAPETSFEDAGAPPAGAEQQPDPDAGPATEADAQPTSPAGTDDPATKYLQLAQRTQADFENYRKRMARENAAAIDRGVGKLAKELLPALDHLDHALTAAAAGDAEVVKGFALVRDEIVNALGRVGIQPFAPAGEVFDPTEHEAMASQPAEDAESGTVIEVYQQGYRINGAVLRPARVVVAA